MNFMTTQLIPLKTDPGTYLISDKILIRSEQDALDLLGNSETQTLIMHDYNFEKDFFDLSTKKLGDVLQKFTNYRVRVAIIGDFSKYPSAVLPNFITESNRFGEYIFVHSLDEVKKMWA